MQVFRVYSDFSALLLAVLSCACHHSVHLVWPYMFWYVFQCPTRSFCRLQQCPTLFSRLSYSSSFFLSLFPVLLSLSHPFTLLASLVSSSSAILLLTSTMSCSPHFLSSSLFCLKNFWSPPSSMTDFP